MKIIKIFTDGACSGNPGIGGWGVVMLENDSIKTINGYEDETTNNRMELKAAIEGIKNSLKDTEIILFTDSKYVKNGITEWIHNWKKSNWTTSKKEPVKNRDLWEELEKSSKNHEIEWQWVKAHSGIKENEKADLLARSAIPIR